MDRASRDLSGLVQEDGSAAPVPPAGAKESAERVDIDLLFRRVTELQTKANETDKPWYRNPSMVLPIAISIGALAASILIPVKQDRQARKQRTEEQLTTDRDALSTLVGQIVDLRKENAEKLASGSNTDLSATESQLLNAKKLVLQEKAKNLLSDPRIKSNIDPAIVRVLASEVGLSGEVSAAKQFLRDALQRKNVQGWERAWTATSLAYWEMLPDATSAEVADGRWNMQQSVNFFQQQPGETSKEALVQTYLSWANQELLVNNGQGAKQELHTAQLWLDRLHPLNTDKPFLQGSYLAEERRIDGSGRGRSPTTDSDTERWYGSWTVNIGPKADRSGPLVLFWNKQTNAVDARLDVFEHRALVERYAGTGTFLKLSMLRIDWLVVLRSTATPGYPLQQTSGYTVLRLDKHNRLTMSTYLLGEPLASGHAIRNSD